MRLLKFTLALFVLTFAFTAQSRPNCQSLLESKDFASELSKKILKRAWTELSLMDAPKETDFANFNIIWQEYKPVIEEQILDLEKSRPLNHYQKQWLRQEIKAELAENFQVTRAGLRVTWEYSKTFIITDTDRHDEMLKEINDQILYLTSEESVRESSLQALVSVLPQLKYAYPFFRVH